MFSVSGEEAGTGSVDSGRGAAASPFVERRHVRHAAIDAALTTAYGKDRSNPPPRSDEAAHENELRLAVLLVVTV